jgi:hypothetical protein
VSKAAQLLLCKAVGQGLPSHQLHVVLVERLCDVCIVSQVVLYYRPAGQESPKLGIRKGRELIPMVQCGLHRAVAINYVKQASTLSRKRLGQSDTNVGVWLPFAGSVLSVAFANRDWAE